MSYECPECGRLFEEEDLDGLICESCGANLKEVKDEDEDDLFEDDDSAINDDDLDEEPKQSNNHNDEEE